MSHSSRGSVVPSRAADEQRLRVAGLAARPRAASRGEGELARCAGSPATAPRHARTQRARRRTRRAAGPVIPTSSRAATTSGSGPSAAEARCQASRSGSPEPASASARARCARRRSWARSRPGRPPSGQAGGAPRRTWPSPTSSPDSQRSLQVGSRQDPARPTAARAALRARRCRRPPPAAARLHRLRQAAGCGRGRPARHAR